MAWRQFGGETLKENLKKKNLPFYSNISDLLPDRVRRDKFIITRKGHMRSDLVLFGDHLLHGKFDTCKDHTLYFGKGHVISLKNLLS